MYHDQSICSRINTNHRMMKGSGREIDKISDCCPREFHDKDKKTLGGLRRPGQSEVTGFAGGEPHTLGGAQSSALECAVQSEQKNH